MFFVSFRKHHDKEKENNLLTLIIKMEILFAHAIIISTACASSVFPFTQVLTNQHVCFLRAVF